MSVGSSVGVHNTEGSREKASRACDARERLRPGLAATLAIIALIWGTCAEAADPRVILLRGWFGVFSTGMDGLADELGAKGVDAKAAGHLHWSAAVADILRERSAGKSGPLILVGHSQGANNVIDMARALEPHRVPVDLLVTLAPFMQDPVPANVLRAVNYYQSPGWGAPLVPARGFHGRLSNIDVASDLTITHITIDKSTKVRAEIVREIIALVRADDGENSAGPAATAARSPSSDRRGRTQAAAGAR